MVAWRHKLGQSQSLQQFKREADEVEVWMGEKMQTATDDSYKDPTNLPVSRQLIVYSDIFGITSSLSQISTFSILMVTMLSPLKGKLQKHQAFEAEVVANKDRIFSTITMGQGEDTCSGARI